MSDDLNSLLAEMMETRNAVFAKLMSLPDASLKLANPETKRSVRALLSMYMSHERNHIVQVEKTRKAIGAYPSEVQMLLAQAWQSRGDLLAAVIGLSDAELAEKPAEDAWSVKEILEHTMNVEKRFLVLIEEILKKSE